MSPLQNGSDLNHQSYVFPIEEQSQIGEARRFALLFCDKLDFNETRRGRVSIIVTELAMNLFKYGRTGKLIIRLIDQPSGYGLEILSIDHGPGIENLQQALVDGFTTGSSPGTGLGAVKRQADQFDIYSILIQGTVIFTRVFSSDADSRNDYELGAVAVPMSGEILSGDAWCVRHMDSHMSLMMVDGLGHGPKAHETAQEAISEFKAGATANLTAAMTAIHQRLRGTRGAAVYLSNIIDLKEIDYASVGNIRSVLQTTEKTITLLTQNGTAGLKIPPIKLNKQIWDKGVILIIHSDGINTRWDLKKYPGLTSHHAAIIAGIIYRDFDRGSDDTTVVVMKGLR